MPLPYTLEKINRLFFATSRYWRIFSPAKITLIQYALTRFSITGHYIHVHLMLVYNTSTHQLPLGNGGPPAVGEGGCWWSVIGRSLVTVEGGIGVSAVVKVPKDLSL